MQAMPKGFDDERANAEWPYAVLDAPMVSGENASTRQGVVAVDESASLAIR
jgi:hypothetical protein